MASPTGSSAKIWLYLASITPASLTAPQIGKALPELPRTSVHSLMQGLGRRGAVLVQEFGGKSSFSVNLQCEVPQGITVEEVQGAFRACNLP